jgi:hypothetical protein
MLDQAEVSAEWGTLDLLTIAGVILASIVFAVVATNSGDGCKYEKTERSTDHDESEEDVVYDFHVPCFLS